MISPRWLSEKDPDMVYFRQFKQRFGEDGNVLVIGLQDSSIYKLGNFNEFRQLTDTLAKVEGVNGVLSVSKLLNITKDTATNSFRATPIFMAPPRSQRELDSLMRVANSVELYKGQPHQPQHRGHAAGPQPWTPST